MDTQSHPLAPVTTAANSGTTGHCSPPPPAYIRIPSHNDDDDDSGNDDEVSDAQAVTRPLRKSSQSPAAVAHAIMGTTEPNPAAVARAIVGTTEQNPAAVARAIMGTTEPNPSSDHEPRLTSHLEAQSGTARQDSWRHSRLCDNRTTHTSLPAETISTFNVGGTIFETHCSTLRKLPDSPLAHRAFLQRHYRSDRQQYFFDRDPDVFGAILNYLRTGELHLPTKYCGPAVKTELEFWGVGEDEIEECCWTNYSAWTTTLEALRKLEKDRKVHMPRLVEHITEEGSTGVGRVNWLRQVQMKGWALLNSPHSSLPAQVYSYASLVFVIVSIFSFIAQTHPFFRVTVQDAANTTSAHHHHHHHHHNSNNSTVFNVTLQPNTTTIADTEESDTHPAMLCVDAMCLVFFLAEFLMRLLFSPRKCKLLVLPMTVFELLALLPDLIEFGWRLFQSKLGATMAAVDVVTFLRVLRIFRIFRLMRHFPGLWILFYTLKASLKELLLLLLFLCVGMLFFGSLIYYTDDRQVFTSIPMACWWSIVTMTTVGYGDMYPRTNLGYLVGSATAVCGVLVIGFTVPVLVNNFILYYQHTQCAINRESTKKLRANIRQSMARQEAKHHDQIKLVAMTQEPRPSQNEQGHTPFI